MARARSGETGPLWLVADQQLTGKGRRDNRWVSPEGNLFASLLLTDPCDPALMPQLSLLAAVTLRQAALAACGFGQMAELTLKWPNDLMLSGKKIAGLLLEGGTVGKVPFAIVGCGVNINSHPEGTSHPATDFMASGLVTNRDKLFGELSDSFVRHLAIWDKGHGFAPIRAAWLDAAHGLGQPIRVNSHENRFDGIFEGLDPDGSLIVRVGTTIRKIGAGDVFYLDPTPKG